MTSTILAGRADSGRSGFTYYAEVCVAQSTGITFLALSGTHITVDFLNEVQMFSSDTDLFFGVSLVGFGHGERFLLSEDRFCWRISIVSG